MVPLDESAEAVNIHVIHVLPFFVVGQGFHWEMADPDPGAVDIAAETRKAEVRNVFGVGHVEKHRAVADAETTVLRQQLDPETTKRESFHRAGRHRRSNPQPRRLQTTS